MWLESFVGENLRAVARVELHGLQRVNFFCGRNGAGKTSVLEGIHLLGLARSFRTRRLRDLMSEGASFLRAVGRGESGGDQSKRLVIGVERTGLGTSLRMNGASIERSSLLARQVPLFVMRPESQELIAGPSEERRRLMDWALFHVEHGYAEVHARYRRVLAQRNASLRQRHSVREIRSWDDELIDSGQTLDLVRANFYYENSVHLSQLAQELVGMSIVVSYLNGIPGKSSYADALRDAFDTDRQRGFTSVGAHRADLSFFRGKSRARDVLSRGETKLLVLGVLLAHAAYVNANAQTSPILLVDDLASELDEFSRARFFAALSVLGCQSFVTAVDTSLIPEPHRSDSAMFHVEQGTVQRVL